MVRDPNKEIQRKVLTEETKNRIKEKVVDNFIEEMSMALTLWFIRTDRLPITTTKSKLSRPFLVDTLSCGEKDIKDFPYLIKLLRSLSNNFWIFTANKIKTKDLMTHPMVDHS